MNIDLFKYLTIAVYCFTWLLNPLMPDGKKKGHTYLNKPAALLPPGIKGLINK